MKIKITEPQYKILVKDKSTIDDLSGKFPQWDFTNATIRREKNPKNNF